MARSRDPEVGVLGRRTLLVALLAIAALRVATLGAIPLLDKSEARYAEIGRQMVVTSDWVTLQAQSHILEQLTTDPRWRVFNSPEYVRHGKAFRASIGDLHRAAVEHDLKATPKAYVAVTLQCVSCHRYLARERLAQSR